MAPTRTTNKENRAFSFASDVSDVSDAEASAPRRRAAAAKAPRVVIEEDTPKAAKSSSSGRGKMASSGGSDDRGRTLEEKLEKMTAERDAIQSEFDSLRELRKTEPERLLSEVRRVAEAKSRHAQELITALKTRLESSERRVRALEAGGATAATGNASSMQVDDDQLAQVEQERDASRARERELEQMVKQLQLELKTEVASSRALINGSRVASSSGASDAASSQASAKAMADERAVRRLYEDLTGLIVNGIEKYDAARDLRRFKVVFAGTGYYDLQLTLEESRSALPSFGSSSQSNKEREDLVYYPHLDKDRDAELLESGCLPPYMLDPIRFDRVAALKFTTNMQRGLSKNRVAAKK